MMKLKSHKDNPRLTRLTRKGDGRRRENGFFPKNRREVLFIDKLAEIIYHIIE